MRPTLCALVLCSCAVSPPDLNKPCVLVRGLPDGGSTPLLKTDPVIADQSGADILSYGATECVTQICVRDAAFVDSPGDTSAAAQGYCSAACGPCTSFEPSLDQGASTKLSCRALLLDPATLMGLKASDPQEYMTLFGSSPPTATFCARGPAATP